MWIQPAWIATEYYYVHSSGHIFAKTHGNNVNPQLFINHSILFDHLHVKDAFFLKHLWNI